MKEQETIYGSGSVQVGTRGARLEVSCMGMHYAFSLVMWKDGAVGASCVTRRQFQYANDQDGLDDILAANLREIFNEALIIRKKTILCLDDNAGKGRVSILITDILDDGEEKNLTYQYKWSPYLQQKVGSD